MRRTILAALAASTLATTASAQDVIVMRRHLAPARIDEAPSHTTFAWQEGEWSQWSSSCGTGATRTRTVTCMRADGTPSPDGSCAAPKPEASQTEDRYSGCTYAWSVGDYSPYNSTCSKTATRTRTVSCRASDPANPATTFDATATSCPSPTPTSTETTEVTSSCTYSWATTPTGDWASKCSATNTRPVTAVCRRSDGEAVPDAKCSGPKPTVETAASCAFTDPGAEDGSGAWYPTNGGYEVSTAYARSGSKSFLMRRGGGMSQNFQWPAGNGFRLSFWIYVPTGTPNPPAYCYDGDEVRANHISGISYKDIPRGVWVQRTTGSSYMNPRSGGSSSLEILSTAGCYNTSTEYPVYIDDITLEVFP